MNADLYPFESEEEFRIARAQVYADALSRIMADYRPGHWMQNTPDIEASFNYAKKAAGLVVREWEEMLNRTASFHAVRRREASEGGA